MLALVCCRAPKFQDKRSLKGSLKIFDGNVNNNVAKTPFFA